MTTITEAPSRAEIEECLANLVHTLHRMPAHWTDRRAALHAQIDQRLHEWQAS